MLHPSPRLLALCAGGIVAGTLVVHGLTSAPAGDVAFWSPPAASPGAPRTVTSLPVVVPTGVIPPSANGTALIPGLGDDLDRNTATVVRGQISILDELMQAIAERITAILRRIEGR